MESALRALEREGAILETIAIPLAKHAPAIGYLSIGPEALSSHRSSWLEKRGLMNDALRVSFAAIPPPRYTEEDAKTSFSDSAALDGVCRFAFFANLTGLPAATAPVAWDPDGLPIGLQLVGDAWDEAGVLGALAHMERAEIAVVRRADGAFDLVG